MLSFSGIYILLSLLYLPSCALVSAPYTAVTKALPVLFLIAALAFSSRGAEDRRQYFLAIAALLLSMLGDIAGEFKPVLADRAFILQIAFFAVAQAVYMLSFLRFSAWKDCSKVVVALVPLVYAAFYGGFILSHVGQGAVFIAVSVYLALISLMGASAALQNRRGWAFFVVGAALFIASDSILAYNAFVSHIHHSGMWIMYTYYAAQWFLNIPLLKK